MKAIILSPEFCDLPPAQIVARLADRGEYVASESSMYRFLEELDLKTRRGPVAAPTKRVKPDEKTATNPNQIWSWDITYLRTLVKGRFFKMYLALDVWSRKVVAHAVHERECGELAQEMLSKAIQDEAIERNQLTIHMDNGGPMKHHTLAAKLEDLEVSKTHSRPRVSNDNPYSESLFRTVKTRPEYPSEGFATLEAARKWVDGFVAWYNEEHLHSAVSFTTPGSRHRGEDREVLKHRQEVYAAAREARPERWTGKTRSWERVEVVRMHQETAVL